MLLEAPALHLGVLGFEFYSFQFPANAQPGRLQVLLRHVGPGHYRGDWSESQAPDFGLRENPVVEDELCPSLPLQPHAY